LLSFVSIFAIVVTVIWWNSSHKGLCFSFITRQVGVTRKVTFMSNKLFVGNLAWSVTSEKLHEVFSSFGPLVEAKVLTDHQTGRSRGFGFVTFKNEEDADRATAEMHNKEIEGRPIRCDNTQQPNRKDRSERRHREPKEGRQGESRSQEESRPRREDNRSARPNYDMYQVSDIMPNPDKGGRCNRRDNRRKDRNHDDRW
jgi:RNA recognition motif-containing protein